MKNYGFDDFYGLLAESYVDKQVNKAARYIERNHSRLIGLERTQAGNPKTAKDLANDVKNQMPILVSKENNPKPGKFIVGASRIFYDEIDNNRRDVSPQLSRYIRTLIQDGHTDQFDEDLNGMSFEQLEQTFSKRTQEAGQNEKNEFSARKWERNPEYDIVRIDSTEEAKPYRRFLNPNMPWCITGDQHYYDSYTNGGLGVFYFVLKKGYENLTPVKGENSPHDEYGESMMAVAVDENGQLLNCTSRWNGSGDFFTAKQLSELLGVNFYETFLPRSFEETVKKLDFLAVSPWTYPMLAKLGYMIPKGQEDDYANPPGWLKAGKPDYGKKEIEWVYYRKADNTPEGYDNSEDLPEILYSRKTGRLSSSEPLEKLDRDTVPDFMDDNDVPIFISKDVAVISPELLISPNLRLQVEEGNWNYFMEDGALYDRQANFGLGLVWLDEEAETLNVKEGTVNVLIYNDRHEKLKSVHLPEGVKYIGSYAFNSCKNLTDVNWPKSLESISRAAFSFTGITSIDTKARIGLGSFQHCQGLKTARVVITGDAKEAFEESCIDYLEILPGSDAIAVQCFKSSVIEKISFPEGLKAIGNGAFAGVRGLSSLTLPSTLETFGSEPFAYCRDLKSVKFTGGNMKDFGFGAFYECKELETVEFEGFGQMHPNRVFGYGMFQACVSLRSINLPIGYEIIGDRCFSDCFCLETVHIPEGYKLINSYAFDGATELKTINLPSTLEGMAADVFKGAFPDALYIHENSELYPMFTKNDSNRLKWMNYYGLNWQTRVIPYTDESQLPRGGGAPVANEQLATESFSSFLAGRREGGSIPRRLKGF